MLLLTFRVLLSRWLLANASYAVRSAISATAGLLVDFRTALFDCLYWQRFSPEFMTSPSATIRWRAAVDLEMYPDWCNLITVFTLRLSAVQTDLFTRILSFFVTDACLQTLQLLSSLHQLHPRSFAAWLAGAGLIYHSSVESNGRRTLRASVGNVRSAPSDATEPQQPIGVVWRQRPRPQSDAAAADAGIGAMSATHKQSFVARRQHMQFFFVCDHP